jgi:hypothetical protein
MSNDLDSPATKRDLSNLRIELVDRMQRIENEMISLRADFAGLKGDFTGLKGDLGGLRNSMRWQIIVPSLTLIVSLIIHYVFH